MSWVRWARLCFHCEHCGVSASARQLVAKSRRVSSFLLSDIMSDDSSEDDFINTMSKCLLLYRHNRKKKRNKPRFWMSNHIRERPVKGDLLRIFHDLQDEYFKNYFRVNREQFIELLSLIKEDIKKQDTNFRKAISPLEKLAVTLRYLATGDSFRTLGYNYRMNEVTVSRVINDTCTALWDKMQPKYMKTPERRDWEKIADDFNLSWQFKNCVGAIDGKHVSIKCPPHSGSSYFNYKKFYSVVLLAVVDAHKKFIVIDVGSMGRFSDGGILNDSAFGRKLDNDELDLPIDRPLDDNGPSVPYVFIGDQAFALRKNLLRQYPTPTTIENQAKRHFNYRLCRARNVVENAFGILSSRWRAYRRPFECKLELVDKIIKTSCVLHNYLMSSLSTSTFQQEDDNVINFSPINNDRLRATREAFNVRNIFCNYFNTTGALQELEQTQTVNNI